MAKREPRTSLIAFKVSKTEQRLIERAAIKEHRTMSGLIRHLLFTQIDPPSSQEDNQSLPAAS